MSLMVLENVCSDQKHPLPRTRARSLKMHRNTEQKSNREGRSCRGGLVQSRLIGDDSEREIKLSKLFIPSAGYNVLYLIRPVTNQNDKT